MIAACTYMKTNALRREEKILTSYMHLALVNGATSQDKTVTQYDYKMCFYFMTSCTKKKNRNK